LNCLYRQLVFISKKDKVVLFAEKLTIGKHDFYFELQTRYTGNYTLNPAKVSLMYYPVFYGREGLKKVKVME
jgi:alpha-2-macroglobulin